MWRASFVVVTLLLAGCPMSGGGGDDGGPSDMGVASDGARLCSPEGASYCGGDGITAWFCDRGHWVAGYDGPCWHPDGGPADLGDPPDLGEPCGDEGRYVCESPTRQCCHGYWIRYYDGPCLIADGGGVAPDCVAQPTSVGCPCTPDRPGTCPSPTAPAYGGLVDCSGGVWTFNLDYACCD